MRRLFLIFIGLFASMLPSLSEDPYKALVFENTVADLGQILYTSGPKTCSFTAVNRSDEPIVINNVVSSCGCTKVSFPREAVAPGAKAVITAVYANDEGPIGYFDKTLTVYLTNSGQQTRLHVRGISQKQERPDEEVYTSKIGSTLAMLPKEIKLDNILQGLSSGGQTTVVNLGTSPVTLSFTDCDPQLKLEISPNPIPAGAHAVLKYSVSSIEGKWGYNTYFAEPVVDGVPSGNRLTVKAFTQENFSSLSRVEKMQSSWPVFDESTFSFGRVRRGTKVTAAFKCTNKGKIPFVVHKADFDNSALSSSSAFPAVAPGAAASYAVSLNTENLPLGEALLVITLTTNSAIRPVVTLFLAGWVEK